MNKIIIFQGYYLPFLGGIERYTQNLSKELIRQGYEVTIVCSNHDNLPDEEETEGIKVYRLPVYNIFKNRYPIIKKNKKYKEIWQKISSNNYDFIICQTRFHLTTLEGIKLSKEKKLPIICLDHGSSHFTVNNKILDFLGEKYEHALTNKVKKSIKNFYGVSNRCVEWLKHFKIEARGVIYNSIDDKIYEENKDKFYPVKKNKTIITYSGRLIKEKGLYLLCAAFERLKKEYKNIELYIAGDGPIYNDLVEKYGKNVNFLGKLAFNDLISLYNSTDIFVYPSMYAEGLPTSILEAGIFNCAVIATDRGGTIEVINNGENGIIMEENEESLYNSIKELLDNKDLIKKYKANIHKTIMKNFTWKETTKRLKKEIKKIKEK